MTSAFGYELSPQPKRSKKKASLLCRSITGQAFIHSVKHTHQYNTILSKKDRIWVLKRARIHYGANKIKPDVMCDGLGIMASYAFKFSGETGYLY